MYTLEKSNYKTLNPYYVESNATSSLTPSDIPVNTTIKPIDRDKSTLEIEKNERVFLPTGEILTATGKRHWQGGTPVNLPPNSFIFSDYKPLGISKHDKDLFELKKGGLTKGANTPARVLAREIDLDHHNRMLAIGKSSDHDGISKKSAELMLKKNFKKVGQIAYLQEEKKGFPDGLPGFAQGTAPVKDPNIQQQEEMSKQYRGGGFIPMAKRGMFFDPNDPMHPGDKRKTIDPTTGRLSNTWNAGQFHNLKDLGDFMDYPSDQPYNTLDMQNWMMKNHPDDVNSVLDIYGQPNAKKFNDNIPGVRFDAVARRIGTRTIPVPGIDRSLPQVGIPSGDHSLLTTNPYTPDDTPADIASPPGQDVLPYDPYVPLTPAQKESLGVSAYNLASINKYDPKRMQESFTPLNMEKINSQPYLNALNNQTQQAYKANQVMNPYQARANNSNIYGRGLEQVSQTLGNIDNQNIQISNQQNQYNNQGINNTAAKNVGLDGQYHDQVNALDQNYDNEKRFARNRLSDQYMQYRSQDDDLQMRLASQQTMGTKTVYVGPNGDISQVPKPGYTPRQQAAPVYDYNPYRNSISYTGAGLDFNNLPNSQAENSMMDMYKNFVNQGIDKEKAMRSAVYWSTHPRKG